MTVERIVPEPKKRRLVRGKVEPGVSAEIHGAQWPQTRIRKVGDVLSCMRPCRAPEIDIAPQLGARQALVVVIRIPIEQPAQHWAMLIHPGKVVQAPDLEPEAG